MERYFNIQEAINKHDLLSLSIDTPLEEWEESKYRFWNEYVYPKFEHVYFKMFPDDKLTKDDTDRFNENFDILDYNKKIVIALFAWLKQEGFFHFFEGEIYFIVLDPTELAFVIIDGIPFQRYSPEIIGILIERVVNEEVKVRKRADRLNAWVAGMGFLLVILLWNLIF